MRIQRLVEGDERWNRASENDRVRFGPDSGTSNNRTTHPEPDFSTPGPLMRLSQMPLNLADRKASFLYQSCRWTALSRAWISIPSSPIFFPAAKAVAIANAQKNTC